MKALISDYESGSGLLSQVGTRCRRVRMARRAIPASPNAARGHVRNAGQATHPTHPISSCAAFTVIELLVVIAMLAVLAVMLLPALAGTQIQSKTTACTARYQQWAASANLYANDNRGWLPTADPAGGGAYAWDMGTAFPGMMYSYGVDIADWFCPMRPQALDAANTWAQINFGHPIQKINDLKLYWSRSYPQECQINDNYWVPRYNGYPRPLNPILFPRDYSRIIFPPPWLVTARPTSLNYGWPVRIHDIAVPHVPFISDLAASGQIGGFHSPLPASPYVTNLSPNTAHFANGTLLGVNGAYADGHVEAHNPAQMRPAYSDGANYWFY